MPKYTREDWEYIAVWALIGLFGYICITQAVQA